MRAFICGLKSLSLDAEERAFLRDASPWGVILFRRNVESREQVARLTAELRDALGRHAPVLVDQEGGRVQRLNAPNWRAYPSAARFEAAGADADQAARFAWLGARLMAHDLREVGIDVDCLPVLDAPAEGSHAIISDRAYSRDPARAAKLGRAAAEGLMAGGVAPVMKHIPGHGRARADSHLELPVVNASRAELEAVDFPPFIANADLPMAMSAHVVYTAIDASAPGTQSKTVVGEIIRGLIGFDGLLMTDDLSMKALTGSFRERAERAIAAGCDMVLHCNGDLAEAGPVAEGAPLLAGKALERAEKALACVRDVEAFDVAGGVAAFETAMAMVG
ncbi:beta-N-acetylhexosaminidase [Methylocystis parvus]|uniref:beta-N-acetylhexosaminidase n=1 Tax=Methylocystis parvus TaxID=134 RepID=A0A6B8MD28_9HYPH|nr:beta-N-acetylhexosaminidase [Methylocystis parvus]QGM99213.1 beta-N-acetylhexosaminidase [Methylocystis parvus]WBK00406.1 beta-N-acetylhexosaminidase [Methylocystis parvus OBBP]